MKLLIATANLHKVDEIRALLADVPGLLLVSLREFPDLEMPEETGITMQENARIKALHCATATNLPSLADDSGIEVDALQGEPGVRSARWVEGSDEERTQALLNRLNGVPADQRKARYRCALCLALPSGETGEPVLHETEAVCEGRIAAGVRGEGGFGYDPVFEITPETGTRPEWVGQTLGEAPAAVKAEVSHRARAVRRMIPTLSGIAAEQAPDGV